MEVSETTQPIHLDTQSVLETNAATEPRTLHSIKLSQLTGNEKKMLDSSQFHQKNVRINGLIPTFMTIVASSNSNFATFI